MRFIKCEKGMAMPLVLMILLVLGLLGGAIFYYSTSEMRKADRDEKSARSYYLARAGAESLARYIISDPTVLELIPEIDDAVEFDPHDLTIEQLDKHVGEIRVTMKRIETNKVEIIGIGLNAGVEQKVTLLLESAESFDGVVYSLNSLDFHNNVTIEGDVTTGGKVQNIPKDYEGNITEDTVLTFETITFPPVPEYYGVYTVESGETKTINISPSDAYQRIDMANNSDLIIDASSGDVFVETDLFDMHSGSRLELRTSSNHDLKLVVDQINLAYVKVTGNGVASFYVRSKATIQTPHGDVNVDIEENALLVFYLDNGCIVLFQANSTFEGLIYGPEATVEIGGNADFAGSMIVEQFKGTGGSFKIGSAGTKISHLFNWEDVIEAGDYVMIRWARQ